MELMEKEKEGDTSDVAKLGELEFLHSRSDEGVKMELWEELKSGKTEKSYHQLLAVMRGFRRGHAIPHYHEKYFAVLPAVFDNYEKKTASAWSFSTLFPCLFLAMLCPSHILCVHSSLLSRGSSSSGCLYCFRMSLGMMSSSRRLVRPSNRARKVSILIISVFIN